MTCSFCGEEGHDACAERVPDEERAVIEAAKALFSMRPHPGEWLLEFAARAMPFNMQANDRLRAAVEALRKARGGAS